MQKMHRNYLMYHGKRRLVFEVRGNILVRFFNFNFGTKFALRDGGKIDASFISAVLLCVILFYLISIFHNILLA